MEGVVLINMLLGAPGAALVALLSDGLVQHLVHGLPLLPVLLGVRHSDLLVFQVTPTRDDIRGGT